MTATKFVISDALVRSLKWPFLAFAILFCSVVSQPASAGTITIVKDAQPNDAQDFSFYAFGPNSACCMPFQLDDDMGAVGGNSILSNSKTWTLPAGTYSFKEDFANPTPTVGWTLSSINCTPAGGVTIDMASKSFTANLTATGNITCTFVNKTPTATIKVIKALYPANDPGRFTLQLKNSSGAIVWSFLNAGNGTAMGPVTVALGTYTVGEIAGTNGTNMSDYGSAITGAGCNSNGTVTVAAGDNRVCTITNKNKQPCTGYPLVADVYIYNASQPFGPRNVDICHGGHVVFHNVNSGAAWTIQPVTGPSPFTGVFLLGNSSSNSTSALMGVGTEEYKIDGAPPFVLHGFIHIH